MYISIRYWGTFFKGQYLFLYSFVFALFTCHNCHVFILGIFVIIWYWFFFQVADSSGDSSWPHINSAYLQQRFSPANRFIGMTVATRARPFSRCTMFTWWCVRPNVVAFIWTVVAFIPPYTCLHLHFHVPIKIPVTLSEHCLFYIRSDFFVLFGRNILARSENIYIKILLRH